MPDNEKMKEKLVLYLSTLSESAQLLLLKSLERDAGEQQHDRATQLILEALKEVLKLSEPVVLIAEHVRKELFRACDPFLTTINHINKVEARISSDSLDAIWAWVSRDIASNEQKARLEEASNDLDDKTLQTKVSSLCQELLPSIQSYVNKLKRDPEGPQKLGNQLGGSVIYEDLLEFLVCGEKNDGLKPILVRLPATITSWSSPEGEEAFALVSRKVQQEPLRTAWVFSAISRHLSQPRLKLELATRLAGSDDAIQVAATVYSPAVKQVFADLEALLALFEKSLQGFGETKASVKHLSDWRLLAKALETELELAVQSPWGRELAEMKTKLSELLEHEIVSAPGLVRKALRAPKQGALEHADENLLQDAMRAVEMFKHVERMKDILALNAEISRIRKELDQSFEILTTSLVDRTKQAAGDDIKACKQIGNASVVMARHIYDEDYAASLRRQLRAASTVQELAKGEPSVASA